MSSIDLIWFRRDLRLRDLPSLLSAADSAASAVAVFVLDDALLDLARVEPFCLGVCDGSTKILADDYSSPTGIPFA